jgi:hypothetical protein
MLAVTLAVARGSCTSASNKLLQLTAGGRMLQDGPSTFCFNLNPAVLSADTPCRSLLASADGFNITFQYGARASSDSMALMLGHEWQHIINIQSIAVPKKIMPFTCAKHMMTSFYC